MTNEQNLLKALVALLPYAENELVSIRELGTDAEYRKAEKALKAARKAIEQAKDRGL